jgi:hypothetical protein
VGRGGQCLQIQSLLLWLLLLLLLLLLNGCC